MNQDQRSSVVASAVEEQEDDYEMDDDNAESAAKDVPGTDKKTVIKKLT